MLKLLAFLCIHSVYAETTVPLFVIERSTNKNIVHYDAQLTAQGRLDPEKPVVVYWEMKEKGGTLQDLNGIERRRAYGFKAEPAKEDGSITIRLVPQKERPIRLWIRDGKPIAETEISGKKASLKKLFIQTSGKGLIPKVTYMELFGEELAFAQPISEKIDDPK